MKIAFKKTPKNQSQTLTHVIFLFKWTQKIAKQPVALTTINAEILHWLLKSVLIPKLNHNFLLSNQIITPVLILPTFLSQCVEFLINFNETSYKWMTEVFDKQLILRPTQSIWQVLRRSALNLYVGAYADTEWFTLVIIWAAARSYAYRVLRVESLIEKFGFPLRKIFWPKLPIWDQL